MKCEFHVGQKIVCVVAEWTERQPESSLTSPLREGHVYTVEYTDVDTGYNLDGRLCKQPVVVLSEVKNPCLPTDGFASRRFRPVQSRKTDISIFTDLLEPSKAKQAKELS